MRSPISRSSRGAGGTAPLSAIPTSDADVTVCGAFARQTTVATGCTARYAWHRRGRDVAELRSEAVHSRRFSQAPNSDLI